MANQRELLGTYRKAPVWTKLAEELKKRNFHRTPAQVDTKIKQLKKQYKEEIDKLHAVMKRRAVVNPPTLLESSVSLASRSDRYSYH